MQSLNILMAVIQIGIMMNVVSRLTHIKGFAECTESELNRMTDKILNGIVFLWHEYLGVFAGLFGGL